VIGDAVRIKALNTLGADRFYNGLNAFGIGRRSGIDLPGEAAGLLRAPAKWRTIELADHGFGQGVAVTPIQLATAYAAIANGGLVMRPYVVAAAYDAAGNEIMRHTPQALRRAGPGRELCTAFRRSNSLALAAGARL